MKKFYLFLFLLSFKICLSQISILSTDVAAYNTAGEGDLFITDTNEFYIGLEDGTLRPVGIVTKVGANAGDVLVWNDTENIWESSGPDEAALIVEKSTIRSISRARFSMNPVANVNTGANIIVTPTATGFNETLATIVGQNLTGFEGNLRFIVQPNFLSTNLRTNFFCNFFVNGVLTKVVSGPFYSRTDDSHNETGANVVFEYENALPADTFSFGFQREGNTGTVQLISAEPKVSFIFAEQYADLEIVTNVSATVSTDIVQGPTGPQGPQGIQGPTGPVGPANFHAFGRISVVGAIINESGVNTAAQLGVGRYQVTFDAAHPNGADYPIVIGIEQNAGTDDYVITYTNVIATGFEVEIKEQDDGGGGGAFRDASFSFFVPL